MENEVKKALKNHIVELDNQRLLKCSGILSVDTYDPNMVTASLDGKQIVIGGGNLKIKNFNEESGALCVEGEINLVKYQAAHEAKNFIKRLFK